MKIVERVKYVAASVACAGATALGVFLLLAGLDNHFGIFGGALAIADKLMFGFYAFCLMLMAVFMLWILLLTDIGLIQWVKKAYSDRPTYLHRLGIFIMAICATLSALIALIMKLVS